jgi:hypothetical protein
MRNYVDITNICIVLTFNILASMATVGKADICATELRIQENELRILRCYKAFSKTHQTYKRIIH